MDYNILVDNLPTKQLVSHVMDWSYRTLHNWQQQIFKICI